MDEGLKQQLALVARYCEQVARPHFYDPPVEFLKEHPEFFARLLNIRWRSLELCRFPVMMFDGVVHSFRVVDTVAIAIRVRRSWITSAPPSSVEMITGAVTFFEGPILAGIRVAERKDTTFALALVCRRRKFDELSLFERRLVGLVVSFVC